MLQFLDKFKTIFRVSGKSVQPIAYDGLDTALMYVLHHPLEVGTLCAAAREALIFINQGAVRLFLPKIAGDILAAHLDLIFDALAFACEF